MRAIGTLVLVFGAVLVVYLIHIARRTVSAGVDAAALLKETGSVSETARRLYARESQPEFARLSMRQEAYIKHNWDEFVRLHASKIEFGARRAEEMFREYRQRQGLDPIVTQKDRDYFAGISVATVGKQWCEARGVH